VHSGCRRKKENVPLIIPRLAPALLYTIQTISISIF
jgi:hypothetical protein